MRFFSLNPKSKIANPKLFNYFIRSHQHVRRNRQADLLGSFEIDHKVKFRRLLDGKISRLGSL
jgi:hypothetical protein